MTNEINIKNELNFSDYVFALLFCVVFTIGCTLFSTRVLHWFIFPLIACGVLVGVDAVGWLRGRYNLFDPKALIGILGLHFFFTAPLLVVVWEWNLSPIYSAAMLGDYRPWLGLLAIFNFFGLIIYRLVENSVSRKPYNEASAKVWSANDSRWFMILTVCIAIAFIAQVYLVFKLGYVGQISYNTSERWEIKGGSGIFRLLGGAGPILLMILLTLIHNRVAKKESSLLTVYLLLIFMAVISFLSGGLVGSRGATVWKIFWIVGIMHFYWRRFTVKQAVLGFIVLMLFMNIYGFFKHLGTEGLKIFKTEGFATAAAESGVTMKGILIGDLSRANVNAYMAYVLVEKPYSYDYWWGKTIWGDILVQFPIRIYPNYYNLSGTSGKMRAGTDLMMGAGHFDRMDPFTYSRYVYGLIGQVMLNFGILPIPLAFIVLGYCVGRFRRAFLNWKHYDMRFLLAPIIIHLLIMLLTNDFNNILTNIIFMAVFPFVTIWLISIRIPRYMADEQDSNTFALEESYQND